VLFLLDPVKSQVARAIILNFSIRIQNTLLYLVESLILSIWLPPTSNWREILVLTFNKSVLYQKLESIVGSENLTDKEIVMEAYTAAYISRSRARSGVKYIETPKKPDFIVKAGSTEEVQEIVRLARANLF